MDLTQESIYGGAIKEYDEQKKVFYHSLFRSNWKRTLENDCSKEETSGWIRDGENKVIYICNDLKEVLRRMDMHPDDRDANRKVFEDYIEELPKIFLNQLPASYTWYNRTTKCINLRPGRTGGTNYLPTPIEMKGQNSHAIIVGRTGSGKSVFLNNLILNMMFEYSPWELELYLADFKKVEMSRYMNKYPAPHVRACAATSEVDYVQSLIQFIKEKKDDREKLFARLGYVNIETFREAYFTDTSEVVMPRILFLVDEFQQLFLDANMYQKSVIDDLITDITRKGRSQGVHLMFASQDMSGALNQKQMSNFKIRFALPCDVSVSGDILGNSGAVNLKTGQVIVNTESKEFSDNVIYSVPIVEDKPGEYNGDDEYFFRVLKQFQEDAEKVGYRYKETQKFYDEDKQVDIGELCKLLERPVIRRIRTFEEQAQNEQRNFMSLVLGRKVVYSTAEYDIENFFLDYAKNRCVLCLSGNSSDLAYFQRLIAVNIKTMDISRERDDIKNINQRFTMPFFYDLNPLVSSLYTPEERFQDFDCLERNIEEYSEEEIAKLIDENIYYRADELEILCSAFSYRKQVMQLLRNPQCDNARNLCIEYFREEYLRKAQNIKNAEEQEENIEWLLERGLKNLMEDDSNLLEFLKDLAFFGGLKKEMEDLLKAYYRYKILNIRPTYKLFAPSLVWISGIENVERLPGGFDEVISNAMDYNFLPMFFSTTGVRYDIKQASNYIFVAGNDPKLYDDYLGKNAPKGNNDIKIRCLIKNTNQNFAFKKYRCRMNAPAIRSIDFDSIL